MDDVTSLRDQLIAEARRQGFAAAGIADVRPFTVAKDRALDAITAGRLEGMPWFTPERVIASADLPARHPWGRSLVALAWPYQPARLGDEPSPAGTPSRPRGRIAAYACVVPDYHELIAERCDHLTAWLRARRDGVRVKRFIDHGWALDRAIAERAGLGFSGKNSCLITPAAGSYVLLAALLLSVPLPPSRPSRRNCGTCQSCIPACPTGAITAPGVIDSRRCIAYLTIEHRGAIPEAMRPLIGTWAFGCDLCQEVCPINVHRAPPVMPDQGPSLTGGPVPFPDLIEALRIDDAGFAARFRHTALWRTGAAGLRRNAAIALGNAGDHGAVDALTEARDHDRDAVVRDAAAWALERLGTTGKQCRP